MKFRDILLGAASTLTLGAVANADDNISERFDWSGFYVGGHAGVARLQARANMVNNGAPGVFNLKDTGVTGGIHAGWNAEHDQFIFGLEGDISYVGLQSGATFSRGKSTISVRSDYDWLATARARAGIRTDNMLFFLSGGVALAHNKLRLINNGLATSSSKMLVGWAASAGIEAGFSPMWTGRIEYLYANLGSNSAVLGIGSAVVNPSIHLVRLGITRKFCMSGTC